MIDTKALRNKVLDLAIQGKLTEQLESDGTAEELFAQIQEEKQRLIKEGKIKKEKPLPPIADEEIPFEIPKNWIWCRLYDIGSTNIGLTYHPSDVNEKGTLVIRSCNIQNGRMDYSDKVFVNCGIKDNQILKPNDIVICARNGSKALVGKNAIFEGQANTVTFGAFMAVFRTSFFSFVHLYLNTQSFKRYYSNDDSKQINQVTQAMLKEATFPLPPLAEQKRIVKRVEEIFKLLDIIDEAQKKYSSDAEILKNKLITMGIQGKLTEQLESDGTAEELFVQIQEEKQKLIKEGKTKKEKPLPPVSDEEILFEIPKSWKWVRLSDISNNIWAGRDKPDDFVPYKDETRTVPVVANGVKNEGILGYTTKATASKDTITVAGRGTIGFAVYREYDYCPIVRLIVIEQSKLIHPKFLQYFMRILPENSVGSSTPQLTVPMIKPKVIPLPPYSEQKRIADKLDEVLRVIG